MKALRYWVTVILGFQFFASVLFAEKLGDGLGIPVKLSGAARAMPTGPAEASVSVDIMRADGSAQTVTAFGSAGGGTASERFLVDPQSVSLEPGRTYSVQVYAENTTYVWPLVVPPLGYEVHWSGQSGSRRAEVPTPDPDALGYFLSYLELKIVPTASSTEATRAGVASKLGNGGVYWQVSLGSLANGATAGFLELAESGRNPSGFSDVFSYQALNYTPLSDEVYQALDGGRQIVAPEVAVDIQQLPVSSDGYTIKFFGRDQVIDNGAATTPRFTFTGSPFVVYTLRSPNGTATALEIKSETRNVPDSTSTGVPVVRTAITSITRSGVWPAFTWTRNDWTTLGSAVESREVRTWSAGALALDHNEQIQVLNSLNVVARAGYRSIESFSWGEEATNESAGSGNNQIVTDRTYYTSTAAVDQGSLSYPRLATTTGGAWEAIEYYSAVFSGDELLDTSYKTGVVKKRFRPFLTTQAPSPTADLSSFTAGEVTSFEYSDDYFTKIWGLHYRPTKIETKVDGTVTRLITQTYADSSIQVESVSRPVVTLTRTDKSSSSSTHVQIIKYFREDTPDLFLRKQIHSIERADGTKDSYIYERGTFVNNAFAVATGAASRISVVHGTINTSSTTACPSPGTYELDPVFLVTGMSTKESVIRDEYARVRRRETYVFDSGDWRLVAWESITYSRANQITSVQTSNGLVKLRTYTGELLDSETDYNGIKRTFLYDSSGRLISSTKVNGEISNFEYDADGRVVKSSASSTRTTETISSTQEFDTAGRLIVNRVPGVVGNSSAPIPTQISYNTSNRTVSTTYADGGTRIESYFINGMMQSLGGTAVVNKFYSYSLDSDGFLTTNIKFGTENSARYQESVQDRYRRVVKTRRPGFYVSGSPVVPDSIEESIFDPATNRLTKTVSTGYANTLYVYGLLGNLERQGLDLNGTGGLELSSSDRVTDYSSRVILDAGVYWLLSEVRTYPTAGVSTPQLVSSSRERLTGFAPDVLEESRTTNEDGRVETRTVTINRTSAKIRTTNSRTSSGSSATSYEESTDGRLCEVLTFDGILHKYTYDFLGRAGTENNPRLAAAPHGGLITKGYYPGTYTIESATQSTNSTPRTLFINNCFDSVGRLTVATNANGDVTRRAFSPRGELLRIWGDGANPSESGYNVLGENTSITTWPESLGVWNTAVWPTVQGSSTVQIVYEPASGLLHKRIDASNSEVEYWYNERGQVSQRMWARKLADNLTRVKTTYTYFAGTGELSGKSYNDSSVTNSVGFTYTRAGLAGNIYDVRGSEVSYYHSSQKFRLINKSIPGFYGTRTYSATYDSAGRYVGFKIGTDAVPDADFSQTYVLSDSDRINRVEMKRASTTYIHSYSYHANSSLLSGYSSSGAGFTVDMGYETDRDLSVSITSRNSALNPISSFLYEREANGQRKLVNQSGFSVSDFGGTIVQEYTYTSRGEIIGADGKLQVGGGSPEPVPGRNHDYKYDNAGNRLHVRRSMEDSDKDLYSTNLNGQYLDRGNTWMHTAGTVAGPSIAVSVSGGGITGVNATLRRESYWYQKVPISSGSPTTTTVTFTATNPGAGTGGADLVRTASKTLVVPAKVQVFSYDPDGNLLSDGLWNYTWDAENRLVEMKSSQSAVSGGHPNRTLTFVYDYLGRRVQKRVVDGSAVLLCRRYLYDGWNLIAEFDVNENLSCGALLRSYTWGLDTQSEFSTTGNGGSLLQITDHVSNETYFPSYDGNGNLVALTQASTGALVASYEYSPFGELLRCEGSYAKTNPFRFSTKFVDDETGLVYFGYRYYDARNGRFISRDPMWESGGTNLYSYAGNDPVNGQDTLGLFGASYGIYDPFWDDPTFGDIWLRFGLTDWDWGYGGFVDPRMPVIGRPPLRSPRGLNFGTTRLSRSGLVFFNSEEGVEYGGNGEDSPGWWSWIAGIFVSNRLKESRGIAPAEDDERIVADRVGDAIIKNNKGLEKIVDVQDAAIGMTPLGSIRAGVEIFLGEDSMGRRIDRGERSIDLASGIVVGSVLSKAGKAYVRIRHYTNRKGRLAIEKEGIIRAKDKNTVFAESAKGRPLSPRDAEDTYGIGGGRGRDYVETDVPIERVHRVWNQYTKSWELTIEGDVPLQNATFHQR